MSREKGIIDLKDHDQNPPTEKADTKKVEKIEAK